MSRMFLHPHTHSCSGCNQIYGSKLRASDGCSFQQRHWSEALSLIPQIIVKARLDIFDAAISVLLFLAGKKDKHELANDEIRAFCGKYKAP